MDKFSKFSKSISAFGVTLVTGLVAGGIIVGKDAVIVAVIVTSLTTIGVYVAPPNKK